LCRGNGAGPEPVPRFLGRVGTEKQNKPSGKPGRGSPAETGCRCARRARIATHSSSPVTVSPVVTWRGRGAAASDRCREGATRHPSSELSPSLSFSLPRPRVPFPTHPLEDISSSPQNRSGARARRAEKARETPLRRSSLALLSRPPARRRGIYSSTLPILLQLLCDDAVLQVLIAPWLRLYSSFHLRLVSPSPKS
jgi:hypothetical protein